jgi:hypothetical protein
MLADNAIGTFETCRRTLGNACTDATPPNFAGSKRLSDLCLSSEDGFDVSRNRDHGARRHTGNRFRRASGPMLLPNRAGVRRDAFPQRAMPRRRQRIKFNLMVSADCEPTSALRASAINRHVVRVSDPSRNDTIDAKRLVDAAWATACQVPSKQRIGETGRCTLKEKTGAATRYP